ncbi:MAG: curlin repeat-containing protein [Parvibaculaceae bacterium]
MIVFQEDLIVTKFLKIIRSGLIVTLTSVAIATSAMAGGYVGVDQSGSYNLTKVTQRPNQTQIVMRDLNERSYASMTKRLIRQSERPVYTRGGRNWNYGCATPSSPNEVILNQSGNSNVAFVSQWGDGHVADINQSGDHNIAVVKQRC